MSDARVHSGRVTWLLEKQMADVALVGFDTVLEGADNEGWQPAMSSNGEPRQWDNERIVEGFISSENWDTQNDKVLLSAFTEELDKDNDLTLIEWITKNATLTYLHGASDKGEIPLGKALAWKIVDGQPKVRWGVYKGSELVDECWREMMKHGVSGGFSIGGAKVEQECKGEQCVLKHLDVVAVSWTPDPACKEAMATYINQMAKAAMEEDGDEEEDEERLKKPCPWKKAADMIGAAKFDSEVEKALLDVCKAGGGLPMSMKPSRAGALGLDPESWDTQMEEEERRKEEQLAGYGAKPLGEKSEDEEDEEMEKKDETVHTGRRGGKFKIVDGKKVYVSDGEGGDGGRRGDGGGDRPRWSGGDIDPKEVRSDYEKLSGGNWNKGSPKELRNALAHAYAGGHKHQASTFETALELKEREGHIKDAKQMARALRGAKKAHAITRAWNGIKSHFTLTRKISKTYHLALSGARQDVKTPKEE